MKILGDTKQWFDDNGDYTHRLNYNLNNKSIVFDLGGYNGWFAEQINLKYGSKIYCYEPIIFLFEKIRDKYIFNDNILVFPFAISDKIEKTRIYINNDASSIFQKTNQSMEIDCITLDKAMKDNQINNINLLKINIEGGEYVLLEYMIKNNLHLLCDNIQVQFHMFVDNFQKKYDFIANELNKTHYITYQYPFVWENWRKK